jgi:hypothetical protein
MGSKYNRRKSATTTVATTGLKYVTATMHHSKFLGNRFLPCQETRMPGTPRLEVQDYIVLISLPKQ